MIPFESEHQFMATLHRRRRRAVDLQERRCRAALERCTTHSMNAANWSVRQGAGTRSRRAYGRQGAASAGFGPPHAASDHAQLEHDHVAGGLTFLGLQGMIDPPRSEAIAAVRRCQQRRDRREDDHRRPSHHSAGDREPNRPGRQPGAAGGDRPGTRATIRRRACRSLRSARPSSRASRPSRSCGSCGRSSRAAMSWR